METGVNNPQPTLMAQLKEATWPQHQAAEEHQLERSLVAGTLPRDLYVDWLGQRFLVHRALEAELDRVAQADVRVARTRDEALYQAENLRQDLAHFGVDADGVAPCDATAAMLDDISAALTRQATAIVGYYYVFEGSKNGARFIARKVRPAYGLNEAGSRYLDPHGDEQRPLWNQWKQAVDEAGFKPEEWPAIVAAAQRTFDHVRAVDSELYARLPA